MKTISRQFIAAIAFAVLPTGVVFAQDEAQPEPPVAAKPSRDELRDKQLDVTLEARDIERILTKLKRASELSKTRISEAAKTAESASTALDRGDSKLASSDAKQAAEMFREIAKLLEALLAEETPQRIAAARNLANQLARAERQFAKQFQGALNATQSGGTGKVDPKSLVRPNTQGKGGKGGGGKAGKQGTQQGDNSEGQGGSKAGEPKGNEDNENAERGGKGDAKDDSKDGRAGGEKQGDQGDKEKPEGQGGEATKDGEPSTNGTEGDKGKDEQESEKNEAQDGSGGEMTDEERREALAAQAEQLARSGQTLEDILKSISQSTEPEDKEAVGKIEAALKETDLLKAIEAMQQAADMIRSDKLDDARLSSLDIADRMEIAAQRLDAAFRTIVAPQAEELRKLEGALAALREKLDQLETQSQIAAWHREASERLDRAEKLGISDKVREDLLEQMKQAGLGVDGVRNAFNWALVNDRYTAPAAYVTNLIRVQEEVQVRIQSLLLGDITSDADENTPPKYQELVDRYYKVLSRQGGNPEPAGQAAPAGKPEMKKQKGSK